MVEKPLLDKFLSKREKNEKFFKRSLLVSLVKPAAVNRSRREQINTLKKTPAQSHTTQSALSQGEDRKLERQNPVDYNLLVNLETFGFLDTTTFRSNVKSDQPIVHVAHSSSQPLAHSPKAQSPSKRTHEQSNSRVKGEDRAKRAKSPLSSENESYDDEEENTLMIAESEVVEKSEKPKAESISDDQPKSPTTCDYNTADVGSVISKIIPLDKPKSPITPKSPTKSSTVIKLFNSSLLEKTVSN